LFEISDNDVQRASRQHINIRLIKAGASELAIGAGPTEICDNQQTEKNDKPKNNNQRYAGGVTP
jgi:hypothetical protein